MELVELATASGALVVALAVGTVVHELSHLVALRALGVSCRVRWFPDRSATGQVSARRGWASVVPRGVTPNLDPWRLRLAGLVPLTLAFPLVLFLVGLVPDPVSAGDPVATAATVGWLACALPSPQDFSLVWYAERAIEQYAASTPEA